MVSRVAKSPVTVAQDVEVNLVGQSLTLKGKLGQISQSIHPLVTIKLHENELQLAPAHGGIKPNALAGTMRALVKNMMDGVTQGFERKLQLVGVGYRAKAQGKTLNLSLGLSHPVSLTMPEGVEVATPSQTEIVLKGINKQQVCQIAAEIRDLRPPEPYKGKGIRYSDEVVVRKEAKKK